MTKISKSHWVTDGDQVRLSMPFAKVDQSKRLVSGFATLDNIDSQGDVVLAEASRKAFARARGNIREQHDASKAVGRMVDFREETYFDKDGTPYEGIYVTAYVSEGAPDTWTKVLDGTLTGFSIGGSVVDASTEFVKDAGTSVRFIKEYDLTELSLVDNPANQLANVLSIQKTATGSVTVKGMAVETEIQNVFFCSEEDIVRVLDADEADCLSCGNKMEGIGWIEDSGDRAEKVRNIVSKFMGTEVLAEETEGGVEVGVKKNAEPAAEVVEAVETDVEEVEETDAAEDVETEAVEVEEVSDAVAEDVDEVEVEDDAEEFAKKIDELKEVVTNTLEKNKSETSEAIATLEKKIEGLNESFTTKASEFEQKFEEIGENLKVAKSRLQEFEKSLDVMNKSDAFRKSADLEESAAPVQKGKQVWNGAFSVDNLIR